MFGELPPNIAFRIEVAGERQLRESGKYSKTAEEVSPKLSPDCLHCLAYRS